MGRLRSKAQAVERLERERARLEDLVATLDPEAMLEPGVVGEWSVKDVLAHLADWESHMLAWVAAARRGEHVSGPESGLTWHQLKEFNQGVFERHRHEPLARVLADFRAAHVRFMTLVTAMPEAEMLERGRYSFTGKQAIFDWLGQYAAHDAWGARRIGEWLERAPAVASRERKRPS